MGKPIIKDWTGDSNSVYKTLGASNHTDWTGDTLGASNHTDKEREKDDFYATEPKAAELLLNLETFSKNIWECACGMGDLSEVFVSHGYNVLSTDLIDRGYGQGGVDFLLYDKTFDGDIITNPPYKYAAQFVEKAIETITYGHKVAMFLKLQFLEGKARGGLYAKYPPKTIYVARGRLLCAKNGRFDEMKAGDGSAVAYAWYIWEKGYTGETVVKWFN